MIAGKNEKEVRRWKHQYDQKLRNYTMATNVPVKQEEGIVLSEDNMEITDP